jgi:hypothetical protein
MLRIGGACRIFTVSVAQIGGGESAAEGLARKE